MEKRIHWICILAPFLSIVLYLVGTGCSSNVPVIKTPEYVAVGDLRGDWKMVYLERKGKIEPDSNLSRYALTIKGTQWFLSRNITNSDGRSTSNLAVTTFHLDPSHKPAWIDLTVYVGKHTYLSKGIYKLDGDKLTICRTAEGDEIRPKRFQTTKNAGVLAVWKRISDLPYGVPGPE